MSKKYYLLLLISLFVYSLSNAQEIPIASYTTNTNGQLEITVNSTPDKYYILKVKTTSSANFDIATAMKMGLANSTTLIEPLGKYPIAQYKVFEYSINAPVDTDNDGIDDITEYNNQPAQSPINAAPILHPDDGVVQMDSFSIYKKLSIRKEFVQWSEYLNGLGHFKFMISDFYSDKPRVYFINTNKHDLHQGFAQATNEDHLAATTKKGQIIYHPTSISSNGTLGTFAFNYTGGHGDDFSVIERTHELLAANMPFISNNLSFFLTDNSQDEYARDIDSFNASRIPILSEADIFADVDYWGLNQTEGYGFFRKMSLDEMPSARDIVLYESLPNALPRVSGIMTSVIQTPLSHVNLRAVQNKIPNAFIRNPLAIDSIANLLDHYIYYKVEQDKYIIREASVAEVNAWFENIRPKEEQHPPLNLCQQDILPLDQIGFKMFDAFGAKCANVATMRSFGFAEGTIPNGFGIPFYYYQEFMHYNNFFDEIKSIMNRTDFKTSRIIRDSLLSDFRKKIRAATMPAWMLDNLDQMHKSFPASTSVRCRSSTNNEDLPGFNGAGLYTSKTQHPHEGHISKSIKQVYASLWNLRAFDEREFYRVDHFTASMGVLCHPNFSNELANGVGVSLDPLYNTENTFYLNSQIGEELITNPDSAAFPEEILLDRVSLGSNDYIVIQRSNLIDRDSVVLNEQQLAQMREYLSIIHDEFAILYNAEGNKDFAMDIEYKITADNQLAIKQARPWVSYVFQDQAPIEISNYNLISYPNPVDNCINVECEECNLAKVYITNILTGKVYSQIININQSSKVYHIDVENLPSGLYILSGHLENNKRIGAQKFIKR